MDRLQLAHILRAACEVTGDPDVIVLGSQSILGTYDEDDLPPAATMSMEADLAWLQDTAVRERAEKVNGEIGELSGFHESNGYYPEGVSVETATLPEGWQDRLHGWAVASSYPANARFLDKHDLAVSKLAAFREKDREFVAALIEAGLVEPAIIRERVGLLPDRVAAVVPGRILSWLDSISPIR
ncbi:MAG: hypothetical protein H0V23_02735 [Nocardioidaceae bacterium]|nr:hypothetical protein [Nocardioidaceae bacterium]